MFNEHARNVCQNEQTKTKKKKKLKWHKIQTNALTYSHKHIDLLKISASLNKPGARKGKYDFAFRFQEEKNLDNGKKEMAGLEFIPVTPTSFK